MHNNQRYLDREYDKDGCFFLFFVFVVLLVLASFGLTAWGFIEVIQWLTSK